MAVSPVRTGFNFQISDAMQRKMALVLSREGNTAIRNALKKAVQPARIALKQNLRELRTDSAASSGSTHNSIITKYSYPSKGTPNYGYIYVGIDKLYSEIIERNTREKTEVFQQKRNKVTKVHKDRFIAFQNAKRYTRGKEKRKKGFMKSWQTSSLRSRSKNTGGNKFQKNKPIRYWHLLEYGFTHRSGKKFPGYGFIGKVMSSRLNEMSKRFDDQFRREFSMQLTKVRRGADKAKWNEEYNAGKFNSLLDSKPVFGTSKG